MAGIGVGMVFLGEYLENYALIGIGICIGTIAIFSGFMAGFVLILRIFFGRYRSDE
jgi:hypothetical protein